MLQFFLVTVTFYMPGSVNKLNLTYDLQQNQKSSHNFTIYKNKS